jgi:hypothetical protein
MVGGVDLTNQSSSYVTPHLLITLHSSPLRGSSSTGDIPAIRVQYSYASMQLTWPGDIRRYVQDKIANAEVWARIVDENCPPSWMLE